MRTRRRSVTRATPRGTGTLTRHLRPATGVPVSPQIGCADWHHDLVPDTDLDGVIATRAAVGLHGLIRVHVRHLHVDVETDLHPRATELS